MDCYKVENASLQKSELESETTVSLPYHEKLTNKEIEYIIKEIKPHAITPHRR
jgi:dTDP-4-amino-4,6-dideoxygalactose transaminase